jgi:hypothetical protein
MTNEQTEYLTRCASAFRVFEARFPDYENYNSEATANRMAAELYAANLSADNADHLGLVWSSIRPTAPAPVVTEPVAESTDSPLDVQAKELIASGKVSIDSVRSLTAKEFEHHMQYPAWERAVELLPRPAPSLLTRGELVAATGLAHVKNQQGETVLTSDIVESVEKSKRDFWTSLNQDPPTPSMPSTPRGIVNLHQAMHIPNKRQPTMAEALAWEKKDADAVEEMRRKSARAIRVKAHRTR